MAHLFENMIDDLDRYLFTVYIGICHTVLDDDKLSLKDKEMLLNDMNSLLQAKLLVGSVVFESYNFRRFLDGYISFDNPYIASVVVDMRRFILSKICEREKLQSGFGDLHCFGVLGMKALESARYLGDVVLIDERKITFSEVMEELEKKVVKL